MTTTTTNDKPRVGFIGLGAMGGRMAERVRQAGYPLTVYNRSPKAAEPFAARGVAVAGSPKALAAGVDVVVSMLFDDAAVSDVLLGENGVLAAARQGLTVVEMSTVGVESSERFHAEAKRRGVDYLDAPVSGSTPQAEKGELVILVGGEPAVVDRCRPLLMSMGKAVEHLGAGGSGSLMKLVINDMLVIGVQALAEAVALGTAGGIDRKRLLDVLGQTAVVSPGQRSKFANVEAGTYPPAFALRTADKDVGLVLELAERLGLRLPATSAVRGATAAAVGDHGGEDFSVLVEAAAAAR